uniref:Calmodulin n=1 Tax=Lotharella oceanica TaxID=641309 RepID=A0A7S2TMJ6_9EUKA|mmetsp:Transcript_18740/g.35375  ORF Transcript_18740/g.35375 Transcript_18740/m.35375 type:complete len:148 (+) Transcript_18740:100-543(+)|eukprot:CAMPEP_0170175568 /NCGR_PEP_ID=MMETSP0040_2-20121228/8621_1 /TAXON_ID=641309 /ORGANISM="Lotharella oceanica, Strain CCMP622" /LENGTH=147 /DNA_ID=CAMNT_0010417591 /DNA_START=100 /DNA_END=543 /DNA_ORIENTATION=+
MAELKEEELYLEAFNLQIPQNKKIDSSKLGEALRSVGKRLTNENIEALKKKADSECNGGLTFEDFKKFVGEASKIEKTDEEIEKAFKVFDNGEKKGLINLATFKHSIMTLGDKLAPEQVETLFKQAGIDESKETVDYKVFMDLLKTK